MSRDLAATFKKQKPKQTDRRRHDWGRVGSELILHCAVSDVSPFGSYYHQSFVDELVQHLKFQLRSHRHSFLHDRAKIEDLLGVYERVRKGG